MPYLYPKLARLSIPAIALLLTACAGSSAAPPPLIQTQVIKEVPPAALLVCPAPTLPDNVASRDQERTLMLDLAVSYARCKAQLDAVKMWEAQ